MSCFNEYEKLLQSGMFFEFFPHLTGNWEEDKLEFEKIISNKNKI